MIPARASKTKHNTNKYRAIVISVLTSAWLNDERFQFRMVGDVPQFESRRTSHRALGKKASGKGVTPH